MLRTSPLLVSFVLALSAGTGNAATWYVSGTGNDAATGQSEAAALRTLQAAANQTGPGDTVMVMNGTYRPASPGADVLDITRSGTAESWITYQAAPGQSPVIDFSMAWNGIQVDAAYIVISGFQLQGGAASVTLAYATAHKMDLNNPLTSANGILVNAQNGSTPHHIVIQNNVVHDAPGSGISTSYADYITIQHNKTYHNAHWSPYGSSGISLWEMRDIDHVVAVKNNVVGNVAYGNREYIPFYAAGAITHGNGIIIDDNKNTQSGKAPYGGRTYVANNLVYLNGGSGIHAYDSAHIDVINNTAWLNNQSPCINKGQIFVESGNDVNVLNNVGYAPAGKLFYSSIDNDSTVRYDYNLLFSTTLAAGRSGSLRGLHDIVADPRFVAPGRGNFALAHGSPAIDSGTPDLAPSTNLEGQARSAAAVDRGAL